MKQAFLRGNAEYQRSGSPKAGGSVKAGGLKNPEGKKESALFVNRLAEWETSGAWSEERRTGSCSFKRLTLEKKGTRLPV